MKRLLLITYFFPPHPNIGSNRPGGLAKYLPDFGWDVTVLTARQPGVTRRAFKGVETDSGDLVAKWKKTLGIPPEKSLAGAPEHGGILRGVVGLLARPLARVLRSAMLFPDPMRGWIPHALEEGRLLVHSGRYDAILVTSGPESAILVAKRLALEAGLPLVVDFRDLWSRAQISRGGPLRWVLERILERRALASVAALTTVSEGYATLIRQDYPTQRVWSVPTGFDPAEFPPPQPRLSKRFELVYTGRYYPGYQDPAILFSAIREFMAKHPAADMRVRFLGSSCRWLEPLGRRFGFGKSVRLEGQVSRRKAMKAQRSAQLLLLMGWTGARAEGWIPGKVFEYLGARRPVLLVGGERGDTARLLAATGTGVHAPDLPAVMARLEAAYLEFRRQGRVSYFPKESILQTVTQPRMARSFSKVLDGVVREGVRKKTSTRAGFSTARRIL